MAHREVENHQARIGVAKGELGQPYVTVILVIDRDDADTRPGKL